MIVISIISKNDIFYALFSNNETKEQFEFDLNNKEEFKQFIKKNVKQLFVTFNSLYHDTMILSYIINNIDKNSLTSSVIYKISNNLKYKKNTNNYLKIIDLAEIGDFNTKATSASLELIQFNLHFNDITKIQLTSLESIKKYCQRKTDTIYLLIGILSEEIKIRLEPTYNGILNLSNTKLGEHIILQTLGLKEKYVTRTSFEPINLNSIIFEFISFKIPIFQTLLEWLKKQVIKTPKGFFNDIPFELLTLLEGYYISLPKSNKQKNLNLYFRGITLNFGTGGLHASQKGIFKSNSKRIIINIDVNSYYPNIAIINKLTPILIKEFLKKNNKDPEYFLNIYKGFKEARKIYIKPHALNTLYKYALNIIFGKSLQPSSIFGDLNYGLTTTINGQLLLLMLIEDLYINIFDLDLIQINTDGLTILIDRAYIETFNNIISNWEKLTSLIMESNYYSKMVIANVNNYIGIYETGKIVQKGIMFSHKNLPLYKDYGNLIIPKALEAYYVYGINYKSYIRENKDIFNFCKRTNLNPGCKLVYRSIINEIPFEEEYDNVTRYIISTSGGQLVKLFDNGRTELVESKNFVLPLQKINDNQNYFKLIDYKFYINEVEKIILKIEK